MHLPEQMSVLQSLSSLLLETVHRGRQVGFSKICTLTNLQSLSLTATVVVEIGHAFESLRKLRALSVCTVRTVDQLGCLMLSIDWKALQALPISRYCRTLPFPVMLTS